MKRIFLAVLAAATFFTVSAQYKAPLIVANGGYHKSPSSGALNSMSALKAAQKLKVYASECDANLTKDGEVLAVQSGWHPNRKASPKADVQRSTMEKMLNVPFANGEYISTLEELLKRAKKKNTRIFIDIKSQATPQRETELVENVIAIVEQTGMQDNVEYCAAHPWVCFEVAKKAPQGSAIAYVGSNYEPEYVKGMGATSIDYSFRVLKKRKNWIKQAHKLGMTVNTWIVNREDDIRWCIQNGVDIITTDEPVLAKKIIKEMCGKQK